MSVKIIHDKNACIGCGACVAVCPDYWEMSDDGKSALKGSKNNTLSLPDKKCNLEAAQSCPVNCIHIEENGKKMI
jgi:ferredoxin